MSTLWDLNKHNERWGVFSRLCFNQKLFCDVMLMLKGEIFHAHRMMLMCHSAYFQGKLGRECMSGKMIELNLDNSHLKPETLEKVLTYMYHGSMPLTEACVGDVLAASNLFGMRALTEKCEKFLWNMRSGDPAENALLMMKICAENRLVRLQTEALEKYEQNHGPLAMSDTFKELSAENLSSHLGFNVIPFPRKPGEFEAAMLWLSFDRRRIADVQQVLEAINFEDMSAQDLLECSGINKDMFEKHNEKMYARIDRFLKDVLWDHTFNRSRDTISPAISNDLISF